MGYEEKSEGDEGFIPFRTIVRTRNNMLLDGVPIGASLFGYEVFFADGSVDVVPFYAGLNSVGTVPEELYREILINLRLSVAPDIHSTVRSSYRKRVFELLRQPL